jgi:putative PEP-CTERM system TPR-repeat lipoprotein
VAVPLDKRRTSVASAAVTVLLAGLLAGCQKSAPDEIATAEKAITANDNASALIHLKNAAAADPKNARARFLLGRQYAAAGDQLSAVAEFKRARELKYSADELARPLADALLLSEQPSQVLVLVAPMPVQDPKAAASVQAAIGWASLGLRDLPAARQAVDKADKAVGPTAETRLIRARLAEAEGDAGQALKLVDALLQDQPGYDRAWTFKGFLHEHQPDGSKPALEAYAKALAINPKDYIALTATVGIRLLNKDYKAAHQGLEAMRKLAPRAFMTFYSDGRLKYEEGHHAEARSSFQSALNIAPENTLALLGSGLNELRLKAYAVAGSQLSRVVQLEPGNAAARFYLARARLAQGKPEEATATLVPMLNTASPLPQVLLLAAQARLLQGDPKGADQLFGRAAKLHGDNESVRLAMAILNASKGNVDAAVQELQRIAASSADTEADMQLISAHVSRADYPAALAAIQALERKQPDSAAADDLRGQVLMQMGKKAEARLSFESALKKYPLYTRSVASLARMDVDDGHPEKAKERLEAQVKLDPTNAGLHLGLALLAKQAGGDPRAEVAELESATRADPREPRARLALIELHFNVGDLDKALEAARGAVAAIPDNAALYQALAKCLLRSGDSRQALTTFGKLVQLAPKEPAGYLGQAELLLGLKDPVGANKALQQLLEFAPSNLEARRLTVSVAIQQKQPDKALAIAREMQREFASIPAGYALEGEVHMDQKRWEQAAAAFRAGSAKPGGEALVTRQYVALISGNKADEARRVAEEWNRQHPKNTLLLRHMAGMAYDAGDRELARTYYERALAIDPKDSVMLNNLAWILVEAKDPKALAIAERAAAELPDQPNVLDTLSAAYALNKQNAKAIETLRRAIQRSPAPTSAPLRLRLARLYVEAGDRAKANAELESLRDLGKTFPDQAEVRRLMAQIR